MKSLFPPNKSFLCSPSWPRTHIVDQADLELRDLSASASQVLGLKATMPGLIESLKDDFFFKKIDYKVLLNCCKYIA